MIRSEFLEYTDTKIGEIPAWVIRPNKKEEKHKTIQVELKEAEKKIEEKRNLVKSFKENPVTEEIQCDIKNMETECGFVVSQVSTTLDFIAQVEAQWEKNWVEKVLDANINLVNDEQSPYPGAGKVVKKGYLGYFLGVCAIIGGAVLIYYTGNWKLGLDIMIAGLDLCYTNFKMNSEGNYDAKQIIKQAVLKAATIVACAKWDKVIDSVCSKLADGGMVQKALRGLHEFQKKVFEHTSVQQVLWDRAVQGIQRAALDHGQLVMPMTLTQGLYTLETFFSMSDEEKKKFAQQRCTTVFEQQNVATRVNNILPSRTNKLEDLIKDNGAKELAQKIFNNLAGECQRGGSQFMLVLLQKHSSLTSLASNMALNMSKVVKVLRVEQENKIWQNSQSYFETTKDFECAGEVKNVSDWAQDQIKSWAKTNADKTIMPADFLGNCDRVASLKRLEEIEQQMQNLTQQFAQLQQQANQIGLTPEIQRDADNIGKSKAALIPEKNDLSMKLIGTDPKFLQDWERFITKYVDLAMAANTNSPLNFTLEIYKAQLSAANDRFKEHFCKATFAAMQTKLNNVTFSWNTFKDELMAKVTPIMVAEVKHQIWTRQNN